ncbi:MAG: bifunctional oligoribonuclease/PAP phosphatase NrnA [Clostridia bacterium]|nr:bifunctional oligoribonuclease/PAP phosphatase NrnA [Clostridia bacterium]
MLSKVCEALKRAKTVAIYIHINVDCDAMGSALALQESLEQLGIIADVFVHSNFPNNFSFYGDALKNVNKKTVSNYELAVCLDAPNEQRLGKFRYTYRKNVKNTILIDHHILANEKYCRLNYIKESSSTAEILFEVLTKLDIKFTQSICKNLLSGILTDTGRFSYSIYENTFLVASQLLKIGKIKMEEVVLPLFNSMTYGVFQMVKKAHENIEFYSNNKLALIMFSRGDFVETGTTLDDLDDLPNVGLKLKDVQFVILASEDDKGYFRVSFRSKGNLSAKDVAAVFGGNGHLNASGCKIFGEFDEVKQKLIDSTLQTFGWNK